MDIANGIGWQISACNTPILFRSHRLIISMASWAIQISPTETSQWSLVQILYDRDPNNSHEQHRRFQWNIIRTDDSCMTLVLLKVFFPFSYEIERFHAVLRSGSSLFNNRLFYVLQLIAKAISRGGGGCSWSNLCQEHVGTLLLSMSSTSHTT